MHSSSEALRRDALHIEADTIQWHLETIEDFHHQKVVKLNCKPFFRVFLRVWPTSPFQTLGCIRIQITPLDRPWILLLLAQLPGPWARSMTFVQKLIGDCSIKRPSILPSHRFGRWFALWYATFFIRKINRNQRSRYPLNCQRILSRLFHLLDCVEYLDFFLKLR